MKEIFLVRHGNTGYADQYIGATDVSLSGDGIKEIVALQDFLHLYDYDTVFSSPMRRCRQTCEKLHFDDEVIIDSRICEIDFGRWEKQTFDEIEERDPELVAQWAKAESTFCFPEGESTKEFISRILDFSSYIQTLKGKRILIISHGGVIRHLICSFLNLPFDKYLYFQIQSGRVTTINLHSVGGVLTGLNKGGLYG